MRFEGHVDRCGTDGIDGWIFDADAPLSRVRLELMLGEARLGECVADQRRDDLVAAGKADGHVAFRMKLPATLPRSALAAVRLRVVGQEFAMTVPAPPPAPVQAAPPPPPQPAPRVAPEAVRTVSRFGGLWIDRSDWLDELAARHRRGALDDATTLQIFRFVRDGYLVLPGAVAAEDVAALNADIERVWAAPPAGMLIETFEPDGKMKYIVPDPRYRAGTTKLLDLYNASSLAQKAAAAPACMRFLAAIFDDRPKAFQQLTFWNGSQQAMHKDTAYVKIASNPLALAATWLALEDVVPGAGELEYFVGSHRAPDFAFGGVSKWMDGFAGEHDAFLASLHDDAARLGHIKSRFHGRAGDVLVWHADLAHGGSKITTPGATRRSLVTHFTAAREVPFYCRETPRAELVAPTCVFVSQYGTPFGA